MLGNLKRQWQRRMLKDPRYVTLFVDDTQEVVSVDCETTSLKVQEAELLSIGAVKLRGNRILSSQAFYVLVKPTRKLESRNISIHGLRPMDVSEGLDADDAVRQLLDFIGGRPLVGYYLEYDVAVLNKYVRGITGISLPNRQIEVSGRYYDYKFKQNPGAYIDLRLAELIADLQVPALPRHDALNDAITAGMLYLALKQRGFG
ncbi:DNA polymerase III epsilon subunit [Aquitalea magnusonii]|uniref:DNA polymerase III epsilon subunit n=1 Tax=Aquitalea magnusonii TaxID=332411 RepID=A0A3G9GKZ7_9NEIS|nr:3'-5' exonuclease [Aquitalea magnusonii]BBF86117.1 DNA polymerase III epsilon subunit [Aquitalea magnusonii]